MSIPKDPRQLLINLMYIVLTALLALNVSAEILQAFLAMDRSITESSQLINTSNSRLMSSIDQQADAYSQYDQYRLLARRANKLSATFHKQLDSLKTLVIQQSGGLDEDGQPKGIKNKEVATRLMVDQGHGAALESAIQLLRDSLLALVEEDKERQLLAARIPLYIQSVPQDSDKKSWSQYQFQQMPVAAVLPLLSKFQQDAKVSETAVLNHFMNKISFRDAYDAFDAIISADKSYVIKGEPLTTEIFLGAYSSTTSNIDIKVNGRRLPVENGKAVFQTTPTTIGSHHLDAEINMLNPLTGEQKRYSKRFQYEVGERSVALSADKMNVLYVGVDNPLSLSAAGVPSAQLKLKASGIHVRKLANGKYTTKPSRPGRATIQVDGGGLAPTEFEYRIKRIPDPVIKLGRKPGGNISASELKIYKRLTPDLGSFDFDALCKIQGFEVVRVPRGDDVQTALNKGGTFNKKAQRIIKQARSGDVFYFDHIKVRCPGDTHSRAIGGLIFHIR